MGETWIALLRGINLGRARRVAMADLRALLVDLGYRDVHTLRNSGNVVLSAANTTPESMAATVRKAVMTRFGVSSRVTVLSAAELEAAVRENPLLQVAGNPSHLQLAFLLDLADRARLEPLLAQDWFPEALALGTRVAYTWCPSGVSKSPLHKAVSGLLGERMTTRTWSTVLKLDDLVRSGR
jgi:uncharacterized protein (DUF1697 family)